MRVRLTREGGAFRFILPLAIAMKGLTTSVAVALAAEQRDVELVVHPTEPEGVVGIWRCHQRDGPHPPGVPLPRHAHDMSRERRIEAEGVEQRPRLLVAVVGMEAIATHG